MFFGRTSPDILGGVFLNMLVSHIGGFYQAGVNAPGFNIKFMK